MNLNMIGISCKKDPQNLNTLCYLLKPNKPTGIFTEMLRFKPIG